jgi:glycosyltransferase involved in cell wall biosynthesis
MIGASHIHKKKGQIYTIRALKEFHNLYGWSPKSIIPGGFIRCIHNQEIKEATDNPKLNIYAAGALQRPELALAMNRSRFFIHAGPGGQNDRGTLEAMACGCSPIIANSKSAAPFLSQVVHTVDNVNPIHLARYLYELLSLSLPVPRAQVVNEYQRYNGCLVQSIPQLKHLLKFISANPHPSHELAKEALS